MGLVARGGHTDDKLKIFHQKSFFPNPSTDGEKDHYKEPERIVLIV